MPPSSPATPPTHPRLLIVDDDPGQRSLLETFLKSQGFATETADSGENALAALARKPFDMMITDVRMPGISGLETMRRARLSHATLPILLVTAYADIRDAVGAVRDGAVDYLSKPIDLDELLTAVSKSTKMPRLTARNNERPLDLPEGVVAENPVVRTILHDAALIARSESRILITGESGAGKEILADLIHGWSPRAAGPIVKVNCAAIPEQLLESELFGHEKGAFTGAFQQRIGRFEEAIGGTIFLDEIGEMSPSLQAKLLRVTQDGSFRRIGSGADLHSDARILAATNVDIEERIRQGLFREDLFYRLNVVELTLPPLRERPEDILPLANLFLTQLNAAKTRLSSATAACLQRYTWPGNVRELRNAMERAALLSRGEVILPEHLPNRVRATPSPGQTQTPAPPGADPQRLEEIERDAILNALQKHRYNRTETARSLAISRRALTYKIQRMRELGLPVDPPPSSSAASWTPPA